MMIDTKSIVSETEANQNFSKVTKLVDEFGTAVIMKNDIPKYIVMDFQQLEKETAMKEEVASDEILQAISWKLMKKNKEAYEVLSK